VVLQPQHSKQTRYSDISAKEATRINEKKVDDPYPGMHRNFKCETEIYCYKIVMSHKTDLICTHRLLKQGDFYLLKK
jgi:hypothetical protein